MPSFLKALCISSDETIFDDDEIINGNSFSNLGLKSLTNSAEGALSAPEALKLRMQEISRSKSALAHSQPIYQQQEAVQQHSYRVIQPDSSKQPNITQSHKIGSLKTSRDRPASKNDLHFGNLQNSDQKPAQRDRSAQPSKGVQELLTETSDARGKYIGMIFTCSSCD